MLEFPSTSFWRELELKNHSRRDVLWQTEAIFVKPALTVVGMIHAQLTKTEKMAFHENIMCSWIIPKSQNWSCNSSAISAITREAEHGFRIRAASSSLNSRKYRWNSISRDWRWTVIDVFKLSSHSSVLSTTLDNFSKIATFSCITLRRQYCNFE